MTVQIEVSLGPVTEQDLLTFWANQQNNRPDAGTPVHQSAFMARWRRILENPNAPVRTIVASGQVVGYMAHLQRKDLPEVCYELGRPHWGKGYATAALRQFLCAINVRPLYARAAKDNAASIRVLEKCGFSICAEDHFTDDAGREHEEFLFKLAKINQC